MFRTLSFWALLTVGVPILVGEVFQLLSAAVLEAVIGVRWKRIPEALFDFLGGMVAVAFAGLLAAWLGVSFSLWVPAFVLVILIIWLGARRELPAALPGGVGIAVGYVVWVLWR